MTDRQKQLIAAYLPNPRDPDLGEDEYYVEDTAGKVRKVMIREILPHGDYTTYGCYEVSTGRRIDAGWGSVWVGFYMHNLYDNKQDCRDHAHAFYDDWEELRRIQMKEATDDQS